MKILKYLLYVLIGLVGIAILLGIFGPKSYDASRSAVISATPDQLWPYVSSLQKNAEWTPWAKRYTTITVEFS